MTTVITVPPALMDVLADALVSQDLPKLRCGVVWRPRLATCFALSCSRGLIPRSVSLPATLRAVFTKHPHLVNTSNGNYELNLGFKNSFTSVQFNVAGCPRSHLPRVSPHLFHHPTRTWLMGATQRRFILQLLQVQYAQYNGFLTMVPTPMSAMPTASCRQMSLDQRECSGMALSTAKHNTATLTPPHSQTSTQGGARAHWALLSKSPAVSSVQARVWLLGAPPSLPHVWQQLLR